MKLDPRGFATARIGHQANSRATRQQHSGQAGMAIPSRVGRPGAFLRILDRCTIHCKRALSGSTSSRRPVHGNIPGAVRVPPVVSRARDLVAPCDSPVTRGKSSRPLGGSPWAGLGGTRLWMSEPSQASARAGACCGRASLYSPSCGQMLLAQAQWRSP